MSLVFVRGQNPSQQYVSEDDLNSILLQTHFRATLPLKVGHGTKGAVYNMEECIEKRDRNF